MKDTLLTLLAIGWWLLPAFGVMGVLLMILLSE